MNSHKKARRQWQRETLKQIEAKLHPCPNINGVDILHEHRGRMIVFTAWKGDDPLNNRHINISRDNVLALCDREGYPLSNDYLSWLVSDN